MLKQATKQLAIQSMRSFSTSRQVNMYIFYNISEIRSLATSPRHVISYPKVIRGGLFDIKMTLRVFKAYIVIRERRRGGDVNAMFT